MVVLWRSCDSSLGALAFKSYRKLESTYRVEVKHRADSSRCSAFSLKTTVFVQSFS